MFGTFVSVWVFSLVVCVFFSVLHSLYVALSVTFSLNRIFLWTNSHLHHGRICHIDNSSGLLFFLYRSRTFYKFHILNSFHVTLMHPILVSPLMLQQSVPDPGLSLFLTVASFECFDYACHIQAHLFMHQKIHLQSHSTERSVHSLVIIYEMLSSFDWLRLWNIILSAITSGLGL